MPMMMIGSYMSIGPSGSLNELEALTTLENCIYEVHAWMREDMWLDD